MGVELLDEELDEVVSPVAEPLPRPRDYSGSLDWIDELPTHPPLSVKYGLLGRPRDAAVISNVLFDNEQSSLSSDQALRGDFSLLTDNRRWNPSTDYDPGELIPGSARLVSYDIPAREGFDERFIRKLKNPYRPTVRQTRVALKSHLADMRDEGLAFDNPKRVTICIKRSIRREIMHALGFSGRYYKPRRWNPYSWIRC